jgi:hypothetical protein
MFRVYLVVEGVLQMWQEIVVYPLVPPSLLHVVDEPQQVLRLQHLLTDCTRQLYFSVAWFQCGSHYMLLSLCVWLLCNSNSALVSKLSNKVYNARCTPPLAQTAPCSTCQRSFPRTCPSPSEPMQGFHSLSDILACVALVHQFL